jgi:hypothetical protein
MNANRIRLVALIALSAGGVSRAHHSFTATYDETLQGRIEGEVAQVLFRNPHSMIHVIAPGDDGSVHRWTIEWAGIAALNGGGVTRETLRIGDHVIVTGNPGRNAEEHRLRLLSIERPSDGWSWKGSFE